MAAENHQRVTASSSIMAATKVRPSRRRHLLAQFNVSRAPANFGSSKPVTASRSAICYMVFDLLYLRGRSLLGEPLQRRRAALQELLQHLHERCELFSEGVIGPAVGAVHPLSR